MFKEHPKNFEISRPFLEVKSDLIFGGFSMTVCLYYFMLFHLNLVNFDRKSTKKLR